jgi:hypothetical protein
VKILFDQGTPAPLRRGLKNHTVATAYELGWTEFDNGRLIAAAESEFDVLITTDKNLRYQQNLDLRRLAILVLPTTKWPELRIHESRIVAAIEALRPGQLVEFEL